MARIDLDLAHAYQRNPQGDEDYALLPLRDDLRGRRGLRAARTLGLRQDDAAQHRLRARHAVAGHGDLRRPRRDGAEPAAAQHRAGVPVPGDLRHDDGGREPRLPAAQPRRAGRSHPAARRPGRRDARAQRPARPACRRPRRRCQAEDLARPRPGARGRQRGAVRRAADGDRPASEVAAAPQAEADPPRAEADADLRHPRPGRGADLRAAGGGDDARPGGAGGHGVGAVRAPAPHLRRQLHRLAGHELHARPLERERHRDRRPRAAGTVDPAALSAAGEFTLGRAAGVRVAGSRRRSGRAARRGRPAAGRRHLLAADRALRRGRCCARGSLPIRPCPGSASRSGSGSPARTPATTAATTS